MEELIHRRVLGRFFLTLRSFTCQKCCTRGHNGDSYNPVQSTFHQMVKIEMNLKGVRKKTSLSGIAPTAQKGSIKENKTPLTVQSELPKKYIQRSCEMSFFPGCREWKIDFSKNKM